MAEESALSEINSTQRQARSARLGKGVSQCLDSDLAIAEATQNFSESSVRERGGPQDRALTTSNFYYWC